MTTNKCRTWYTQTHNTTMVALKYSRRRLIQKRPSKTYNLYSVIDFCLKHKVDTPDCGLLVPDGISSSVVSVYVRI